MKKDTNSSSVIEAVAKKAGSSIETVADIAGKSINNVMEKANESVEQAYNEAIIKDPVRICIEMARTNPIGSPFMYNGYTKALSEKIANYSDNEIGIFIDDVKYAIRDYKYKNQVMTSINNIINRR